MGTNNMTGKSAKTLEVSVEPAKLGGQTNAVNKAEEKAKVFKTPSLVLPGQPGTLVQAVNFIGKHVVYCPSNGQITNPIDDKDEAHTYAESVQATGKPAVVMVVTAQFLT